MIDKTDSERLKMQRALGRRKEAAARVRLTPGTGVVTVNNREYTKYFPTVISRQTAVSPLTVLGKEKEYDVSVRIVGGGMRGQADAMRHGIARALVLWNPEFRPVLKAHGFLTRDPRAKERKKFGKYKARRGHQWRKR